MKNYTNNLRSCRKERGYTLEALSVESGVPRSTIAAYETGKRSMNDESLEKIAEVLQLDVEILCVIPQNQCLEEGAESYKTRPMPDIRTETLEAMAEAAAKVKDWDAVKILGNELLRRQAANKPPPPAAEPFVAEEPEKEIPGYVRKPEMSLEEERRLAENTKHHE